MKSVVAASASPRLLVGEAGLVIFQCKSRVYLNFSTARRKFLRQIEISLVGSVPVFAPVRCIGMIALLNRMYQAYWWIGPGYKTVYQRGC